MFVITGDRVSDSYQEHTYLLEEYHRLQYLEMYDNLLTLKYRRDAENRLSDDKNVPGSSTDVPGSSDVVTNRSSKESTAATDASMKNPLLETSPKSY